MADDDVLHVALLGGHRLHRQAPAALLPAEGLAIVGEGDETNTALPADAAPDAVLFDMDHVPADAVATVQDARRRAPGACLMLLTHGRHRELAGRLVVEGARAIVSKDRGRDHLVDAIRKAVLGELCVDRATTARIIAEMASGHSRVADPEDLKIASLTAREREVMTLVAKGANNKAIAQALGISDNTVRHHLTLFFAKLDVQDRTSLAVYAFRHRVA